MVSAGFRHTLALRADGTVASLGENEFGQLGDGTSVSRAVPTTVPGLTGVGRRRGRIRALARASRRQDRVGVGRQPVRTAWRRDVYAAESPVKVLMPCPVNAIAAGYCTTLPSATMARSGPGKQ
jgi:hypothetical protein